MFESATTILSNFFGSLQAKDFITVISVVLGWVIVNNQNNKREQRKETRSFITEINKLVNEIEADAITYHTSSRNNYALGKKLLLSTSRLSEMLTHSRLPLECYFLEYTEFDESVTWENFLQKDFTKQTPSSDLIQNIRDCSRNLSRSLEQGFFEVFIQKSKIEQASSNKDHHQYIFATLAYIGLIAFLIYAVDTTLAKSKATTTTETPTDIYELSTNCQIHYKPAPQLTTHN